MATYHGGNMTYDRIIRAGLLQSERYLSLPTDTHRCAFIHVALNADDFGNVEGGARRLQHFVFHGLQVRNEVDVIRVMSGLADVDLVRRYEVDGKEFWHVPRFRNTRTYWKRNYPPSPWCDSTAYTGPYRGNPVVKKGKAQQINAKNDESDSDLTQISFRPDSDLKSGVGVGVKGLGVEGSLAVEVDLVNQRTSDKTPSLEPKKPGSSADAESVVINLPLKDKTTFQVTQAMVAELSELYPDLDVPQSLNELKGWNVGRPQRLKTRKGIMAHIHTWMRIEQTGGASGPTRNDEWLESEAGTNAKAKELGMYSYGGEGWKEFRGRILARLNGK